MSHFAVQASQGDRNFIRWRDLAKTYINRGVVRVRRGNLEGALEDYGKALELRPNWHMAEVKLERFVVIDDGKGA